MRWDMDHTVLPADNTIQYSPAKRSAIHAQAVYFLHCIRRCLVSRACKSATEWCQRYLPRYLFLVSNSVCFSSIYSVAMQAALALHRTRLLVLIRNIGYRTLPNIWVCTFFVRNVHPGERIWIDSNGKMETRHPVEGLLGSEFPAICNHWGVMTAWSRKTWKFCEQFLRFLEKDPVWHNFQNFVPKVYMATPTYVVVLKFSEIYLTGNQRNYATMPLSWTVNDILSFISQN